MSFWSLLIEVLDFQAEYMFYLIGFVVMFIILGFLSRRLGDAMDFPPFYLGYYVSAAIVFGLLIFEIYIDNNLKDFDNIRFIYLFLTFFTLAIIISSIISIKYWGWLFKEFFSAGMNKNDSKEIR